MRRKEKISTATRRKRVNKHNTKTTSSKAAVYRYMEILPARILHATPFPTSHRACRLFYLGAQPCGVRTAASFTSNGTNSTASWLVARLLSGGLG
jgi:hypothetical protein